MPAPSADPAVRPVRSPSEERPCFDPTAYGNGPADSVTDASENAAITRHTVEIGGRRISYTATAGHLVAVDPSSSKPYAKMFYVGFVADAPDSRSRPVTFFYNGGPGSSSVYVLLGSFAPMRIRTSLPDFTPPAPYTIETNPDSLLDRSDLVFINPVGTGYSAAIAPWVNRDFWSTDTDATSIKQFIKRWLTANDRWNAPKFLFGESYGTARTAVLSYMLHEDGIDLNGITLQSSILDYAKAGDPVGLLPTWAADAWYHQRLGIAPPPPELAPFADAMMRFAGTEYAAALRRGAQAPAAIVQQLSADIGIDVATLHAWALNVAATDDRGTALFLLTLLQAQGRALGAYDGRATGIDTGIAARIDPLAGGNDPTMTAVNGAYTVMWNTYLNDDLRFTSSSSFTDLNDQTFANWSFSHIDPTGAQTGIDPKGEVILYTAGDLAATMSLNVDMKVLSANGYFDSVTPFYRTTRDLAQMPLGDAAVRQNLTIRYYPSGHMVYLDGASRTALKADLARMYDSATADHAAMARLVATANRARPASAGAPSADGVIFRPSLRLTPPPGERVGDIAATEPVEVSIYLKRPRPGAPTQDRGPQEAIARIGTFAHRHGLTVLLAEPARRLVRLGGTAAQMQSAFGAPLSLYDGPAGRVRGRTGALRLPPDVAEIVESVLGLDTRPAARPRYRRLRPAAQDGGHRPNRVGQLYGFPAQASAAGACIGLIELGGGYSTGDTDAAFLAMGLPPPRIVAIGVDGAANRPAPESGADAEVALDIQVAGGNAPGAAIAVYFAPNTDAGFADAVSAAIHDPANRPSVLSISWGGAEEAWTAQARQTLDGLFQDAAAMGITVLAAAGDSLATDGLADGRAHVVYPASSPYAVACGGTSLSLDRGAIADETVWNDGDSGTGGGISTVYRVPDFQQAAGLPANVSTGGTGRGIPDVAADAAPASGYRIVVGGQTGTVGGTSAVAPLWAALVALVNANAASPAGFILPRLYANPALFRDIIVGNNCPAGSQVGYAAGPGWDACTGLGVPRAQAIYDALTRPPAA